MSLSSSLPLTFFFFFFSLLVFCSNSQDTSGLPGSIDPSLKCGGCSPCGGATCYLSPPPPPPVYLPPPPPPPKKPSKPGCPPPPYVPGFIYVGAPPGELYPIDQTYSGSTRVLAGGLSAMLVGFLILWV